LRAIAALDPVQDGTVSLLVRGGDVDASVSWQAWVPNEWRSRVLYLSQTRVDPQGCPLDTFARILSFAVYKEQGRNSAILQRELLSTAQKIGIAPALLEQQWRTLSGGENQRMWIAIAITLRPKVLLLDEPTSHCDKDSTRWVEKVLKDSKIITVWVTHDPDQPRRVGGKILPVEKQGAFPCGRPMENK